MRVSSLLAAAMATFVAVAEDWLLVSRPVCNETVIGGFTHPGIFHSCEDLTRAQTKVWNKEEPWYTAFGRMFNESLVGLRVNGVNAYNIRGPLPKLPYGQDAWSSNFTVDAQYGYLNALAFFLTGHPFHRERALHTVRRWMTELNVLEEYIRGGNGLRYLTAACEILRSITTSWWLEDDTKLYHDFAARIRKNWDKSNGMARPDLFFNQGAYGNGGAFAMAIFLGDLELYQQIMEQVTVGRNPDPTIDYAIGMQIINETGFQGQIKEMGRDQAHPAGMLNIVSLMAYSAEIQGDLEGQIDYVDLFTFDNSRFLSGLEYYSKFNLGHEVPFKTIRVGYDSEEYWNQSARTNDRGIIYRDLHHPTDIGSLNSPTAAYYRYRELVGSEKMPYFKKFVEAQTLGFDSLLYMRKGNYEDLNFIWDNGYGASYLDVISGPGANRRFSEPGETEEGTYGNSTFRDVAVVKANTTISYPAFFAVPDKPFLRLEARSSEGTDIRVFGQMNQDIANYHVAASEKFRTVYINTTLEAGSPNQFLYLYTSKNVEIARFNMTGAADTNTTRLDL
ncbi:unnamed protein product [Clonostachys rosea]|uniref:Alginate lyase domain-containing protein n=1 Tax=Bionectria ochroleuca TaxID=29856 RepID=A0ABY6UYZ6_BIOOC|nr:unnamed protein product [Clonostachys rosea]